MTAIRVDVWSDVVCPWCYIGKRRFERALAELGDELTVDVTYHAYQLDPTAEPGRTEPVIDAYAKKFGGHTTAQSMIDRVTTIAASEGIEFHMERGLRANTLLAHRLIWLSAQPGSPASQADTEERLFQAYFVDGLDIGDPTTLAECAAELGFDGDEVAAFLDGNGGSDEVAADLERAAEYGITAVPTFVINDQWSIPGAQDTPTFIDLLRRLQARLADG